MHKILRVFFLGLVTMTAAQTAQAATYDIDLDHSSVEFKVHHLLSNIRGSFDQFVGTLDYEPGKPETWNCEIPFADAGNSHGILMQNFVDAILDGTPLIAPGDDGMGSVELANVLLYSSLLESPVKLPLDGAAWEARLNELIADSKLEKKVVKIANDDFTKSFHR